MTIQQIKIASATIDRIEDFEDIISKLKCAKAQRIVITNEDDLESVLSIPLDLKDEIIKLYEKQLKKEQKELEEYLKSVSV